MSEETSNIIKFPESESVCYGQHDGKITGLIGKFDRDVDFEQITGGDFAIQIGDEYAQATRKEMSQFLWAAAYFLDSNQEWAESEYPALNK